MRVSERIREMVRPHHDRAETEVIPRIPHGFNFFWVARPTER